jgi:hypothetical protein
MLTCFIIIQILLCEEHEQIRKEVSFLSENRRSGVSQRVSLSSHCL